MPVPVLGGGTMIGVAVGVGPDGRAVPVATLVGVPVGVGVAVEVGVSSSMQTSTVKPSPCSISQAAWATPGRLNASKRPARIVAIASVIFFIKLDLRPKKP
jgi:hypothetical protein